MPCEHSQFYALYWWVAPTLERRLLFMRSVYALVDSPVAITEFFIHVRTRDFNSPCLQLSDQFNWFTLQLLTTSGRGRCNYKPLLFHLEHLRSHYAYVEVSMLYGFVPSIVLSPIYFPAINTAVESYT